MAKSTKQYYWIVFLKENLEILLAAHLDAFVAAELLWYPIEGDNVTCNAPDVMVAARPKGHRQSYQQWKERNVPPTVVFEVMSLSSELVEIEQKRSFYEQYGVDEFYVCDPDRNSIRGYIRHDSKLLPIATASLEGWVSPSLNIKFSQLTGQLNIHYPDGQRFVNMLNLNQQAINAKREWDFAKQELDLVTQERDRLLAQLKALGVNPE